MPNTLARVPYARIQPPDPAIDRELQKIERQQAGMFVPKVLVHARSPYSVQATDYALAVDASGGAFTVVLPDAARLDGLPLIIVKTDTTTNAVTVQGVVSGVTNPQLTTPYAEMVIDALAGAWYARTNSAGAGVKYRITTSGLNRVTTDGAYRITQADL